MPKKKDESQYSSDIKKAERLYKSSEELADTTQFHLSHAHTKAIEKHLVKDGRIKYSKLKGNEPKKQKLRKDYANTMADYIVTQAKKSFNINKDLDEAEESLIMSAYAGVTREEIYRLVEESHDNFPDLYNKLQKELADKIRQRLHNTAVGHIGVEHAEEVIKYSGLEGKVLTERLSQEDVKSLAMNRLSVGGQLSYNDALKIIKGRYKLAPEEG